LLSESSGATPTNKGKLVINPQFDMADPFSDDVALVGVGHKLGYINHDGKFTINPQYEGAGRFSAGLAPVRIGGTMGVYR